MLALGNKTALKLLKVLLAEPFHEFKEIELIGKAKTGKGSASNVIDNLIKKDILLEKRVGKAKIISLNVYSQHVFLLMGLFNLEKMANMPDVKQAAIMLLKNKVKKNVELLVVFGSCVDGTATEKSDIDIMVVSNNINKVIKERKNIEEIFGERFNLHNYTKNEIGKKIKNDIFIQNALLRGILIYGYDFGRDLFFIKKEKNTERLIFFNERIKSALRNYINKDYKTTAEIISKTLEQISFYLLSEKRISFTSKKNAQDLIIELPEGKLLQKINGASLKNKINLSEKLVLDILKRSILE
jgi:predicted nucleotidyltransferase